MGMFAIANEMSPFDRPHTIQISVYIWNYPILSNIGIGISF